MNTNKPWFWPDTQGFLAIAIITVMSSVIFVMLFHSTTMDDRTQGVLMTILGVLVGALKDVYGFYFNSSSSSKLKDDTIKELAVSIPPATQDPSGTPAAFAVAKVLIIAFALAGLLGAGSAHAATKAAVPPAATAATDEPTSKCLIPWDPLHLCGALTGNPGEDIHRVVKRIQAVGRDDMNYSILKATAANTNSSKVRLQCLNAIMDAKNAAEGTNIKDAGGNVIPRPDPALVTGIEDIAELVDALSPTGPLMTGCAGAAQLFKTNTLAMINGVVTGAVGLAAGGFAIP